MSTLTELWVPLQNETLCTSPLHGFTPRLNSKSCFGHGFSFFFAMPQNTQGRNATFRDSLPLHSCRVGVTGRRASSQDASLRVQVTDRPFLYPTRRQVLT
jgi:hypothetical protein